MKGLCGWTLLEVGASAAADQQSVSGEGHALVFSDVRHASVCVSRRLSHRQALEHREEHVTHHITSPTLTKHRNIKQTIRHE